MKIRWPWSEREQRKEIREAAMTEVFEAKIELSASRRKLESVLEDLIIRRGNPDV